MSTSFILVAILLQVPSVFGIAILLRGADALRVRHLREENAALRALNKMLLRADLNQTARFTGQNYSECRTETKAA